MADDKKNLAEAHAGDPVAEQNRDLSGAGSADPVNGANDPALTTTGGVKQPDPDATPVQAPGPEKVDGGDVSISREIIDGFYGRVAVIAQTIAQTRPTPTELPKIGAALHQIADDLLALKGDAS